MTDQRRCRAVRSACSRQWVSGLDIVAASTPIRSVHVSDQGRFGFSHIDAEEQGVEALGYVVINRVLGGVLQDALDNLECVDVFCPARIVDVELAPGKRRCGEIGDGERRR